MLSKVESSHLAQFCEEIARIREEDKERKNLPQFNSMEEARKYFGSTPFIEWENKMREKYGI